MTRIEVTSERIRDGELRSCGYDPISLSIRLLIQDCVAVVNMSHVMFRDPTGRTEHQVSLPVEARKFLWTYDSLGPAAVRPFVFDLDIPVKFLRVEAP